MEKPKSYCEYVSKLPFDNLHRIYHDTQYGFPIKSDNQLFERLVLEINQAGLSWDTILKKQKNLIKAYSNFEIAKVANYSDKEISKLLQDEGIIRNKLKINAAIFNAKRIIELQEEYGSFRAWLDFKHPLPLSDWVKLFKKNFKFVGGEITKEFLLSSSYLPGAHVKTCPIHKKILTKKPLWKQ